MRTLAILQNITLDGCVEFLSDWFNPATQGDQSDQLDEVHRQFSRADGLLLGRKTFEDFRGYWPLQTDDRTGITAYLNQTNKYVVTSTVTDPAWENTTVLAGDVVREVKELKEKDGRDLIVEGSISLSRALIAEGLVDEFRLFTYPAVQGRGRRLFPDGYETSSLRLDEATSFSGGVTYTRYTLA